MDDEVVLDATFFGGEDSSRNMVKRSSSVSVEFQDRVWFTGTSVALFEGMGFDGVEGGISSVVNIQIGPLVFFPLLSSEITCQ